MNSIKMGRNLLRTRNKAFATTAISLSVVLLTPFNIFSKSFAQTLDPPLSLPDTIAVSTPVNASKSAVVVDSLNASGETPMLVPIDTLAIINSPETTAVLDSVAAAEAGFPGEKIRVFNPDPNRAIWLSALFPGLGQIYNRRYWKLPIVAGAFVGLGYGTSWNNGMLRDYTRAYNDLLDNDPTTRSYMDFFPSTVKEEDLDKTWLANTMRSRKDYFRRNRDLCVICMIGVYFIAMIDAYVDASLSQFDITPDLSMQITPAVIPDARTNLPGIGLQWAFNF